MEISYIEQIKFKMLISKTLWEEKSMRKVSIVSPANQGTSQRYLVELTPLLLGTELLGMRDVRIKAPKNSYSSS